MSLACIPLVGHTLAPDFLGVNTASPAGALDEVLSRQPNRTTYRAPDEVLSRVVTQCAVRCCCDTRWIVYVQLRLYRLQMVFKLRGRDISHLVSRRSARTFFLIPTVFRKIVISQTAKSDHCCQCSRRGSVSPAPNNQIGPLAVLLTRSYLTWRPSDEALSTPVTAAQGSRRQHMSSISSFGSINSSRSSSRLAEAAYDINLNLWIFGLGIVKVYGDRLSMRLDNHRRPFYTQERLFDVYGDRLSMRLDNHRRPFYTQERLFDSCLLVVEFMRVSVSTSHYLNAGPCSNRLGRTCSPPTRRRSRSPRFVVPLSLAWSHIFPVGLAPGFLGSSTLLASASSDVAVTPVGVPDEGSAFQRREPSPSIDRWVRFRFNISKLRRAKPKPILFAVYKFLVIKYKAYYYTHLIHLATTKLKHPIRIPSIDEWKTASIIESKEAQPQAALSTTRSSGKRVSTKNIMAVRENLAYVVIGDGEGRADEDTIERRGDVVPQVVVAADDLAHVVVRDSEERRDEDTVERRGDAVPQVVVAADDLAHVVVGDDEGRGAEDTVEGRGDVVRMHVVADDDLVCVAAAKEGDIRGHVGGGPVERNHNAYKNQIVVGGDTYEAEPEADNVGEATHRVVVHGGRGFRQWVVAPNRKMKGVAVTFLSAMPDRRSTFIVLNTARARFVDLKVALSSRRRHAMYRPQIETLHIDTKVNPYLHDFDVKLVHGHKTSFFRIFLKRARRCQRAGGEIVIMRLSASDGTTLINSRTTDGPVMDFVLSRARARIQSFQAPKRKFQISGTR
ncbi:hypothetical protein B0H13DRAFT_1866030 [Mycena leptocephala]|nr:hypothetical protein B0H13DRAFT_1866030 [Mycena leptocephala]